jgi:hypothetical protein
MNAIVGAMNATNLTDAIVGAANATNVTLELSNLTGSFPGTDYSPSNFENTYAISSLHLDTLRGNRTNDISVLLRWSYDRIYPEAQREYVEGVLVSPLLVLLLAALWILILLILKCVGWKWKEQLGCSSGSHFRYPLPPSYNEDEERQDPARLERLRSTIHAGFLKLPSWKSLRQKKPQDSVNEGPQSDENQESSANNPNQQEQATSPKEVTNTGVVPDAPEKEEYCGQTDGDVFDKPLDEKATNSIAEVGKGVPVENCDSIQANETKEVFAEDIIDDIEWRVAVQRVATRVRRTRSVFMIAAFLAIVALIVYIVVGVKFIEKSVGSVRNGLLVSVPLSCQMVFFVKKILVILISSSLFDLSPRRQTTLCNLQSI